MDPISQTQETAKNATAPKRVRNLQAQIFQSYLVIAITIFVTLAILAHFIPYFQIDVFLTQAFQKFNSPILLSLMQFISYWGYNPQMPIVCSLILLFVFLVGFHLESLVGALNVIGAGLITGVLKTLVGRGRPPADLVNVVQNLQDKSFPSGHVLTYTSFFGYLFFLTFTLLKPSIIRTVLLFVFGSLVVLVGPSRVYLGEHWPSDTFGAYLMGSIWLLLTIFAYRWGKSRFFLKQPVAPEEKA